MILTIAHKDYDCRLTAKVSVELEEKLGMNPLTIMIGGIPKLSDILLVFEKSAGISEEEAYSAYDAFIADGGSMPEFIAMIMKVYKASGYFKVDENDSKN